MPRPIKSARAKPGSDAPANPPPKAAPLGPQFTESPQESPPEGPNRPENPPDSAGPLPKEPPDGELSPEESLPEEKLSPDRLSPEELSLDRTEPFPPGLFRVPVPNAVFSRMPETSDSALRCLLALIRLSFRFDPAESEWVHGDDWLTRSDVEEECGLSSQGTRNGLAELESLRWAKADRSGKGYRYRLTLGVPTERFTYVPTSLLDSAPEIGSGTALRVVLAVLRRTWGWTCRETPQVNPSGTEPRSGKQTLVHDRWARLSNRKLAEAAGRSASAVAQAAKALQGKLIERVRPGNGPYQYRFLPEGIPDARGDSSGGRPGDSNSFCEPTSNDLVPDRQKSGTPTSIKESFSRDKQGRPQEKSEPEPRGSRSAGEGRAVPANNSPESTPNPKRQGSSRQQRSSREQPAPSPKSSSSEGSSSEPPRPAPPNSGFPNSGFPNSGSPDSESPDVDSPDLDFGDLSPEKQKLAEKLANVGVWAGRIAEILSRFSCSRIRANFQLYRRRAAEQAIRKPGAWLYRAITEGYALPGGESPSGVETGMGPSGSLPPLQHKETVSEAKKDAYVAQGVGEDRFHRCLSRKEPSSEPTFMYFAPEEGGPDRRM